MMTTVTISIQENPPSQKDEQRKRERQFSAILPHDMPSGSRRQGTVWWKAWLPSVFIILMPLAFSGYCWFDSLSNLRPKNQTKTFVRLPIVAPAVSPATSKVPSKPSAHTVPEILAHHIDSREKGGEVPPETQTEPPQLTEEPKPALLHNNTLFNQALALQKDGRLEDAKKAYEDCLERSPHLVSALNNLGVIYIQEKNYSESKRVLETAISANIAYADPYYNLACLYALQNDVKQGLHYLKRAIAADASIRQRAMDDQDLESLRGHVEYQAILRSGTNP